MNGAESDPGFPSNTRRAYRRDVLDFVGFLEIRWPAVNEAGELEGARGGSANCCVGRGIDIRRQDIELA
ncbi:MAG: hypothetical protein AB1486_32855 [Planctomycetota bacterium]